LGAALAKELGLPYQDGDDLHSPENVAKMSIGIPLDDDDRAPWLHRIRSEGVKACSPGNTSENQDKEGAHRGLVIGCSALKRTYRRILRGEDEDSNMHADLAHEETSVPVHESFPTRFVYISGDKEELMERMARRKGHYMKVEMLNSQLATLEAPDPATEAGIIMVRLEDATETQVKNAMAGLEALQ
jgi:gluconokinase